jgi:hypothetical protein
MPSHALNSSQTKKIEAGGRVGDVRLPLTVAPEMKDELIALASKKGTWLMDEVRLAITKHLENSA